MSATEKWEYLHGDSEKWGGSMVVIDGQGFSAPYTRQHGSGRDPKQDANNRLIVEACNGYDHMRVALGNIIERAQEIRDENSGDKCAMDASDIETMARAALESKVPQQRTATVGNQPDSDDVKAATPRATEAHTLAPGLGCASEVREPSGAEQSISRTPATFRDNGSRGDFPAEGELATLHPSGQNKSAGSPDSRKRHE